LGEGNEGRTSGGPDLSDCIAKARSSSSRSEKLGLVLAAAVVVLLGVVSLSDMVRMVGIDAGMLLGGAHGMHERCYLLM
jgi:hypothetical protein